MCHRNHRYPIVDFGIGDRDVSVAFPFLTLEILKFQPWKGFLFLKIQKFAVRRWLGRPREEAVRRGVVRREIPLYGTAGLAGPLAAVIARRQRDEQSSPNQ